MMDNEKLGAALGQHTCRHQPDTSVCASHQGNAAAQGEIQSWHGGPIDSRTIGQW